MSRLAIILGALLLALVGFAAGHPVGPPVTARAHSSPVHRSVGLGRDTVREDDRMERRDCKLSFLSSHYPASRPFPLTLINTLERKYEEKLTSPVTVTWTNAKSSQNLCGDSSFETSEEDEGPSVNDCRTFLDYVRDRNGLWLVTAFASPDSWEEFARVESCVVAVRHTDLSTRTIP